MGLMSSTFGRITKNRHKVAESKKGDYMKTTVNIRHGVVFIDYFVGDCEKRAYRHAVRSASKLQKSVWAYEHNTKDYKSVTYTDMTTYITVTKYTWCQIFN